LYSSNDFNGVVIPSGRRVQGITPPLEPQPLGSAIDLELDRKVGTVDLAPGYHRSEQEPDGRLGSYALTTSDVGGPCPKAIALGEHPTQRSAR